MAESSNPKIPVICVVGPTASGKTALSVELAKRYNAEVVSCDSMQIYKCMKIGTARPDEAETGGIRHHLLGFLEADESFSVAQYKSLADKAIRDIRSREKNVIITGGTGLYFSSLIDNISFCENNTDPELRAELQRLAAERGGEYLLHLLAEFDPKSAEKLHPNNTGRIIRAIEAYRLTGIPMSQQQKTASSFESPYEPCIIGIDFSDRQKLYDRINLRVDTMLENGLIEENRSLFDMKLSKTALQAIGFKEFIPYFKSEATLEECTEKLKMQTRRYAKRQLTWFRRDARIQWIYPDLLNGFGQVFDFACDIIDRSKNF